MRERLSGVDVEKVWKKLAADLTVGEKRTSPSKLSAALDNVEQNMRRAGMLHQVAVEELAEFEMHMQGEYARWSDDAREQLEERRKRKQFSGQVTKDAIESWVILNVKEYREWRDTKADLGRAVNLTDQMLDAWKSRAATLRKMADLVERRPQVDPNMLSRT